MIMTWERLILLSLCKKRPKNIFPDTGGTDYWWFSLCTVVPAVLYLSIFLGHPVFKYSKYSCKSMEWCKPEKGGARIRSTLLKEKNKTGNHFLVLNRKKNISSWFRQQICFERMKLGSKKRPLVLLPNRRCAKGSCQCRSKPKQTSKQLQIELYPNRYILK